MKNEGRSQSWVVVPELPLFIFSFLIHYPWEMLQAPFFVGMTEMSHWEAVKRCSWAAAGDAVLSLAAFWLAALTARSRSWFLAPDATELAAFFSSGIVTTILLEALATGELRRWEYSPRMPILPLLGTGLIPVLQWSLLPPIILWLLRRHYRGAEHGS